MKRNKMLWGAGAVLAACLGGISGASAADLGAKDDTIKLAMLEWTGQHVSTHIAGQLLEKLGYKVEYVTAGNFPEFSGLSDGTLSASVEVWMNNVGDIFPKVLAEKKIVDVGPLKLQTNEGWIYPKYMEQICPGLPDWSALDQARLRQGAVDPGYLPQRPPARLSRRLGLAGDPDHQGQQPAADDRAGGLRRRSGGRARERHGRQEALGHDVLGAALRAGRGRCGLGEDAALQGRRTTPTASSRRTSTRSSGRASSRNGPPPMPSSSSSPSMPRSSRR